MTELEKILSRREILTGAAALALANVLSQVSVATAQSDSPSQPYEDRQVSFLEALRNKGLRVTYLDQLFKRELGSKQDSPVADALYDPDGLLIAVDMMEIEKRKMISAGLEGYLRTEKGKAKFEDLRKIREIENAERSKKVYGSVVYDPNYFGKGFKSKIYLFQKAFDASIFERAGGAILPAGLHISPSEDRIKSLLHSFYAISEAVYKGVDFGNGLVVDSSNFNSLELPVAIFLLNYIDQDSGIGFSKGLQKTLRGKYGGDVYNPAYLDALLTAADFWEYSKQGVLSPEFQKTLTPFERKLIDHIENSFNTNILPDINQFIMDYKRILRKQNAPEA